MAFSRVRIFSASRTLSSLRFRNFRLRLSAPLGARLWTGSIVVGCLPANAIGFLAVNDR